MTSYSIRDMPIVNQIDRAEKDLAALKSRQYVSRRVLATRKVESPLILSETVDMAASPGVVVLRDIFYVGVVFEADSQTSPYGILGVEFFDLLGNPLTSDSGVQVFYFNVKPIAKEVDDKKLYWSIDVRSSGDGTIGLSKFYTKIIFYGTDTGRLSWSNQNAG